MNTDIAELLLAHRRADEAVAAAIDEAVVAFRQKLGAALADLRHNAAEMAKRLADREVTSPKLLLKGFEAAEVMGVDLSTLKKMADSVGIKLGVRSRGFEGLWLYRVDRLRELIDRLAEISDDEAAEDETDEPAELERTV